MRLALVLLRKRMPNGHIYSGKNRLYPKVTGLDKADMRRRLEIEEQNMLILRHPYLTLDQSWGHAKALGKGKIFCDKMKNSSEKWLPNVTIEERFETLKNNDIWD
ncbi:ribosomal protein 63, mitochondrial-like isoform X2 [Portunus trituberculatus]|uniref:Ribosomal protein 63, mitochondrial n=2 Tax=Portunus trituberculatus TaxID=210409 RepID=A0A5B7CQF4_PORTR|nr:ribosomal protein 63, mitochondrial-like isoform X2 [Portunus trituberculatus]XP_045116990.1 ribosomal protein 63, mitochondrial-like isoform X2 [Portunus trituberculatus]XP_045116991.1 ribosomal protein 63, mitochondrial-like isoform X2 [Portunus trituberculatus]XP_045116992.1 ribosomal protein 63, mitochondrial-like isoform X2 [Portunus trituberculatus]MPC10904.1 Ribosomal protein 63, mitochondrial [Portunus trituberculatus]